MINDILSILIAVNMDKVLEEWVLSFIYTYDYIHINKNISFSTESI